jgi:hypothetical protein
MEWIKLFKGTKPMTGKVLIALKYAFKISGKKKPTLLNRL